MLLQCPQSCKIAKSYIYEYQSEISSYFPDDYETKRILSNEPCFIPIHQRGQVINSIYHNSGTRISLVRRLSVCNCRIWLLIVICHWLAYGVLRFVEFHEQFITGRLMFLERFDWKALSTTTKREPLTNDGLDAGKETWQR
jgi:hypothetical protein